MGFILGVFVGAMLGVFVMCLMYVSSDWRRD
jgi:hypothetical protein